MSNCIVTDFLSDHSTIDVYLTIKSYQLTRGKITCRNIKNIPTDSLEEDIKNSRLFQYEPKNPNDFVDKYNTVLTDILDSHAPLKEKLVTVRQSVP